MWGCEDIVSRYSVPPKHIQEKSLGPPQSLFLDCMTDVFTCRFSSSFSCILFVFHLEVKKNVFLILQRIIYLCPLGPGSPLPSFLAYSRISFSKSFLDSMQTFSSTMSKGNETTQPTKQRIPLALNMRIFTRIRI